MTAESPLRGHTRWLRTSCVGAASGEVPARWGLAAGTVAPRVAGASTPRAAGARRGLPSSPRRLLLPLGLLLPVFGVRRPFLEPRFVAVRWHPRFPARRARRQVWWLLGLGSVRSGEPRGSVAGPRAAHAWRLSLREALRAGRGLGRRRHTWDSFPARVRGPEAEHPAWPGPPIAFWQKGKRRGKPALNSVCLPGTRVTPHAGQTGGVAARTPVPVAAGDAAEAGAEDVQPPVSGSPSPAGGGESPKCTKHLMGCQEFWVTSAGNGREDGTNFSAHGHVSFLFIQVYLVIHRFWLGTIVTGCAVSTSPDSEYP